MRRLGTGLLSIVMVGLLLVGSPDHASAATPSAGLVKDLNTGAVVGKRNFVTAGTKTFFAGGDGINGTELWATDATSGGTQQVKDINGGGSSAPAHLTAIGNTVYFAATEAFGTELWKSDGTSGGTTLVKNIHQAQRSSSPQELASVGGTLYFSADDGNNGIELWKSDGTTNGTVLVKDIWSGQSSQPAEITDLNGTLIFSAWEGGSGRELWKSTGAVGNASLVEDIWPGGATSSSPTELTRSGGLVYFAADDGTNGSELWKSDGTAAGTQMVANISPTGSSSPTELTDVNGTLYFAADDGTNGVALWKTDGTTTTMVHDIAPTHLTAVGSTLFFAADDGVNGAELWKTDGTTTAMVEDIDPGGDSSPNELANVGGVLYFAADNGAVGSELWRSGGTAANTELVEDIDPAGDGAPARIADVGGAALFAAKEDGVSFELWKSAGTAANTEALGEIVTGGGTNSAPSELTEVNLNTGGPTLFFVANDGTHGTELWKTDGTKQGTVLVKDINPTGSSSPRELTSLGTILIFTAEEPSTGRELWTSDGTADGTYMITDIVAGSGSSNPLDLAPGPNGSGVFTASATFYGREPWRTDGITEIGTRMLDNINQTGGGFGSNSSMPGFLSPKSLFVTVGSAVYFAASDGVNGQELWRWSSATGADLIKNINPSGDAFPGTMRSGANVGGTVYFSATDGTSGAELWKSNGTETGTVRVKDINPSGDSSPQAIADLNGAAMFWADDGAGQNLWRSNGTLAGTTLVSEVGPSVGEDRAFTRSGGTLYFPGEDPATGRELWRTGGTAANTQVIDAVPGVGALYPGEIIDVDGTVFFRGTSVDTTGYELYTTDGTVAGTAVHADIRPGSPSSAPEQLADVGGVLFFSADDGRHGRELWRTFEAPVISITDASVTEGDTGTTQFSLSVTLDQASPLDTEVDVNLGTATATPGTDHDPVSPTHLVFAPGETSKTIDVTVTGDTIDEEDETFELVLSDPSNGLITDAAGVGTIVDDDAVPALTIDSNTVKEGRKGQRPMVFTVTLAPASGRAVTVNYATVNGSAKAPKDYAPNSGTLTFAAGDLTKTITVLVRGDRREERTEKLAVVLSSPTNATLQVAKGIGRIRNDD